jgi:hypothetical protein
VLADKMDSSSAGSANSSDFVSLVTVLGSDEAMLDCFDGELFD